MEARRTSTATSVFDSASGPKKATVVEPKRPAVSVSTSSSTLSPKLGRSQVKSASNIANPGKPKQSKSRNGCVTCKAKRLKCDETKPACHQCQKRNVTCGGYKKDFKWRSFEESNFSCKPTTKTKRASSGSSQPSSSGVTATGPNLGLSPLTPESIGWLPENDCRVHQGCQSRGEKTPIANFDMVSNDPLTQVSSPNESLFNGHGNAPVESAPSQPSVGTDAFEPTSPMNENLSETPFSRPSEMLSPLFATTEAVSVKDLIQSHDIDIRSSFDCDSWLAPASCFEDLLCAPIPQQLTFGPETPEMLITRYDRQTCGILSVKDGVSENPWRTLVWPLARDSPALYHAICSMAAFHCTKENPHLRVHGMDHMRQSIRMLAMGLKHMRTDAALATTLALVFAESWDRHVSTGVHHLKGAKVLVTRALATHQHTRHSDMARLRFLFNTWVYTDVITRLVSLEDSGSDEIPVPPWTPYMPVQEIDPLMGCATTLFPLISRVATLIQKVRKTKTNSMAVISQAIELKTQIEQWEAPKYFEPPEDPTSDVQHSFQTAQAYRWATLLYLHQAVPEIPSESAAELARRVLILLATVPPSSRTTIVHMYPLLAASCEMESEEDRMWVRERWAAMQSRLMIGSIDRCLEIINEVWERRDAFKPHAQNTQQVSFVKPVDTMKRNSNSHGCANVFLMDAQDGSSAFDYFDQPAPGLPMTDMPGLDLAEPLSPALLTPVSPSMRSSSLISGLDDVEYEKTVRGKLHWVGVMSDWGWEVLLG